MLRNRTGMRVLVLGGGGFIGRALSRKLLSLGFEVHWVTHNEDDDVPSGVENICSEIGSYDAVHEKYEVIIHAASASVPSSTGSTPNMEVVENILPTVGFLSRYRPECLVKIIYLSSGGTVYGNPTQNPVDERNVCMPLSYHGAGKMTLEALFSAFSYIGNVDLKILRPSNVYGPGQLARQGFGLIPTLFNAAINESDVEIFGDGKNVRDYLYIDDLVDACERLLAKPAVKGRQVFNVGSGKGYTVNHVVSCVEKITGCEIRKNYTGSRHVDVREIVLDSSALKNATGWRPHVDLEMGLRRTWRTFINRKHNTGLE